MLTTDGSLLAGRVRYRQLASGFRSGLEPVLLAASVPARPGERVVEAGCGAGAALLCLAARVPGVHAMGVEIDAAQAELAAANVAANGMTQVTVVQGDIESVALPSDFDHALANPPYHPPEGSRSPLTEREVAKRGSAVALAAWVSHLGSVLRHRGSLTLIVPAWLIPAALEAMQAARCPCTVLFPLWPKAGRPAKLVLLRGVRDARSPLRVMAGLVLHQDDGSFTDAARAILEQAQALSVDA